MSLKFEIPVIIEDSSQQQNQYQDQRKSQFQPPNQDQRKSQFQPPNQEQRKPQFIEESYEEAKQKYRQLIHLQKSKVKSQFQPPNQDQRKSQFQPPNQDQRKSQFQPPLQDQRKSRDSSPNLQQKRRMLRQSSLSPGKPRSDSLPVSLQSDTSLVVTLSSPSHQIPRIDHTKLKQQLNSKKSVIVNNDIEEINTKMEKCVKLVESNSPTALKSIRKCISPDCRDVIKRNIALWKDEHNLNLIHYTIIYLRPEILKYLLKDSQTFPPKSQPAICPYAHLAAYLGAAVCVKIILTQRPDDFFESHLPQHVIKLPRHIVVRFHLNKRSKNQIVDDVVLKRVKHFKLQCRESSECLLATESHNVQDLINYLEGICFEESNNPISNNISLPPIQSRKSTKSVSHDSFYSDKTDKTKLVEPTDYFMGKTPLTLAAEKSHIETLFVILELKGLKRESELRISQMCGPLTMATRAMSPEAIAVMCKAKEINISDYKQAVLLALKELLPDCLIVLLSNKPSKYRDLFAGVNKYHILYSQCVDVDESKYRMLPTMTRALLYCNEDVNQYLADHTFPLYSLITISFKVSSVEMLYHTFECLQLLLAAKANPFFNERKKVTPAKTTISYKELVRESYVSAFNCIFENVNSSDLSINPELTRVIMNHSILYVLFMNKTRTTISDDFLFQYMKPGFTLGLDKQVISTLLERGVDPNTAVNNRYCVNAYFEELFEFFRKFPRRKSLDYYNNEIKTLLVVCEGMWSDVLKRVVKILLRQYVTSIPLEAVAITRYFLYLAHELRRKRKNIRPKTSGIKNLFVEASHDDLQSNSSSSSVL